MPLRTASRKVAAQSLSNHSSQNIFYSGNFLMPNKNSQILIVDDNLENIRVLGTVLRQLKCRIAVAQNGAQALRAVEEQIPDLILLDVMMPDMDGFEVCETLKANPKTQDIEIVFVTAAVNQTDELKGLSLGAVDYIHKPFAIPLVQAKVALHLERARNKKELRLKNAALEENAKLREDIERMTRHDLKNPLNALMGYPQLLLLDDNLNAEQRDYLEQMLRAGNEMLNIINNSLDLFKMETGRYQYRPNTLDMVTLIQEISRDLRMLLQEHQTHINIQVENQDDPENQSFLILAEQSLCYSLFANLIRNAIEASSLNDTIAVVMRYDNNDAVISITNSGTVPESIRNTFFAKYSTAGKPHGTGLGTYSAKLMTETQNGSIKMSTDSEKTCLTVRLPAS